MSSSYSKLCCFHYQPWLCVFVRFVVACDLSEPTGDVDVASTGIALSAVAGNVAANYQQTCHENAEQPRVLQAWGSELAVVTK